MMPSKPMDASRRTALLVLVAATVAACATTDSGKSMSSAEPDKLVSDAQVTLSNFVRDPDQTWIQDNLNQAKAILIAPQIVKAGFIFGGSGGRAVLLVRRPARPSHRRPVDRPGVLQPRDRQRGIPGGCGSIGSDHRRHD